MPYTYPRKIEITFYFGMYEVDNQWLRTSVMPIVKQTFPRHTTINKRTDEEIKVSYILMDSPVKKAELKGREAINKGILEELCQRSELAAKK